MNGRTAHTNRAIDLNTKDAIYISIERKEQQTRSYETLSHPKYQFVAIREGFEPVHGGLRHIID